MEALSGALQPYKDIVGELASILTIGQFFSGVFICKQIRAKGNTNGISSMPFIGGIVVALCMLKYAWILNDSVMLTVNYAALILNAIYTVVYYSYSQNKYEEVIKPTSIGFGLVALLWGYTTTEQPELVEFRYGLIVTLLVLILMGSPLLGIKEIVKKKDASSIPFVLTLMGTLVSAIWFIYGIIIMNTFMVVQNIIGFCLCAAQLYLIFKYPGKRTIRKDSKKHK